MSSHARDYQFSSARKLKNSRAAPRQRLGSKAWIRLEGGFAVRPCTIIDRSESGVRIDVATPETVAGVFSLLTSRDAGTGRRCRVKWRRGSQIGAAFI